ncbi:MFS-type transporter SLC18B1-like [Schistocerca americana]|uniref:MFS-type transporter SLC18B1-like n=1 Tax=Schistocerca americana TaxID=7009 RepID=UPI001F4F196D|nr:MFS-type transporter SLC18B1-like [Schistocerca americana]XP_046990960.1 MFS-type transporter SLC18B1-like [Schistocerca americana]XP_047108689.1 MFS-type transporter SLC18B1-like [Schistocerca piceifrons]XP_049949401.1 MFS-type transporter SLC18B1-like [Schistocerca serialis cubense]XP_049949402.1 MFS-type transporter SLC18B1-like [Schistocerca serialis cubense]
MPQGESFTRRQWYTLISIGCVHFTSAICVSLQAPFYPLEAENKGSTASEYGLVFGIFELVSFISSPILGKYMNAVGAKLLLNSGVCLAAVCAILFGLLAFVQGHVPFIALSFVVRIAEALGSSAAVTAAFSITAMMFPHSVATTFATLEVFYGLGYIAGPSIGGVLYSLGGYVLPFVVMGSITALAGLLIYCILPPLEIGEDVQQKGQLMKILKVPAVVLDIICIIGTSMSMGFNSSTLEPHLREFKLPPFALGFVFIISGGIYALTAPFVGRLCDKRIYPKKLMAVGNILIIISFSLIGPAPFIPVPTKLWLCILGLIIHGFGIACTLVPCFIDALRSAVKWGMADDLTTYGLVSGIWAASFALGDFIGPSVAGVLFDTVGFRTGTLFIIVFQIIVFTSVVSFLCWERKTRVSVMATWNHEENKADLLGSVKIVSNGYGAVPTTEERAEIPS